MLNPPEAKRILEAALLASPEPVSATELKRLFDGELGVEAIRRLLAELAEEWKGRAVELVNLSSGWRFQTRAEFQPYLERLFPEKPPRYSRAVMETLAIIAYRQPVTGPEIEEVRGVDAANLLRNLLDKRLIKILGRKDVVGRPILYGTTKQFLLHFGMKDLAELPKIEGLPVEGYNGYFYSADLAVDPQQGPKGGVVAKVFVYGRDLGTIRSHRILRASPLTPVPPGC